MPNLHLELVALPPRARVGPLRKVPQEAAPRAVYLTERRQILADVVREAYEAMPVQYNNRPMECARDVQADVAVHGLRLQHERAPILRAVLVANEENVGKYAILSSMRAKKYAQSSP